MKRLFEEAIREAVAEFAAESMPGDYYINLICSYYSITEDVIFGPDDAGEVINNQDKTGRIDILNLMLYEPNRTNY